MRSILPKAKYLGHGGKLGFNPRNLTSIQGDKYD